MVAAVKSRPEFSERDAAALAAELYGIEASVRELPSERDQNFHLREKSGQESVLKVGNSAESIEILEFQNAAMEHLTGLIGHTYVPKVVPSKSGQKIATVSRPDGDVYPVRLVSYLPATVLANFRPHSSGLLNSLGSALGQIDRALVSFSHPAAGRVLKWDLKHADWIRDRMGAISDDARRSVVQ